jgi:hypothetical protein
VVHLAVHQLTVREVGPVSMGWLGLHLHVVMV